MTSPISVVIGAVGAAWFLSSAVRTVLMPRPEKVWMTRAAFGVARRSAGWWAGRSVDPVRRHLILGSFAPIVLIALPLMWSLGLIVSFAAIYHGLDVGSVAASLELSGSSLTTLGFVPAPTFATRSLAILEALLGLAIVALMISFLPTIYATFSRREVAVGELTVRAGDPPSPQEFITRLHAIERMAHVGDRWGEWELWFVELGETHTSFPALVYFRSARPGRNWLSAAEVALDTAALVTATRIAPPTGQADTMIRAGYLSLNAIADFYGVDGVERGGAPADREIGVTRAKFDHMLALLADRGVVSPVAPDIAWEDFRGWRVNYDAAVHGLRERVGDVPSHWDADPGRGAERG